MDFAKRGADRRVGEQDAPPAVCTMAFLDTMY
jgi:hypothetical protein